MTENILIAIALLCAQSPNPQRCQLRLIDCVEQRAFEANLAKALASCVERGSPKPK